MNTKLIFHIFVSNSAKFATILVIMDYLSVLIALLCIVIINTALWVTFARKPLPHNKTGDQGRDCGQ